MNIDHISNQPNNEIELNNTIANNNFNNNINETHCVNNQKDNNVMIASYIIIAIALFSVLKLNFLPLLFSGILTYVFMEKIENVLFSIRHKVVKNGKEPKYLTCFNSTNIKLLSATIIGSLIILVLTMLSIWIVNFLHPSNLQELFLKIEQILEQQKNNHYLPSFVYEKLPTNIEVLKIQAIDFLKTYAVEIKNIGKTSIISVAYVILGCIIGMLINFSYIKNRENTRVYIQDEKLNVVEASTPLKTYLIERIVNFKKSFDLVFLAQIKISLVNTFLTGLYIYVSLPIFDINLPFKNMVVLLTFLLGLIPVLGNLISNTIIIILSLGFNLNVAIVSLLFLVIIHKLEYFLDAKIIGSQIQAKTWEILLALIVFETLFGIAGLIVGSIFYCYLKMELSLKKLI